MSFRGRNETYDLIHLVPNFVMKRTTYFCRQISEWKCDTIFMSIHPWTVSFIINSPLSHCSISANDLIQLTAMTWMREFIQLAGRVMLPYSSGILTAVLPGLSYDDRKKSILMTCSALNCAQACCRGGGGLGINLEMTRGGGGVWKMDR